MTFDNSDQILYLSRKFNWNEKRVNGVGMYVSYTIMVWFGVVCSWELTFLIWWFIYIYGVRLRTFKGLVCCGWLNVEGKKRRYDGWWWCGKGLIFVWNALFLLVSNGRPPSCPFTILWWEGSTCQKEGVRMGTFVVVVVVGRPGYVLCYLALGRHELMNY